MKLYIFAVLLLQCSVPPIHCEEGGDVTSENTTEVTGSHIFTNFCGYSGILLQHMLNISNVRKVRNAIDSKITQGVPAKISDHPWQVALIDSWSMSIQCGGSIISKYHVLTAAHCFTRTSFGKVVPIELYSRTVVVGSSLYEESNLRYPIKELHVHKFYAPSHHRNDIALLKIDGEFQWTPFVGPICLPAVDEPYTRGRDCVISGFGDVKHKEKNIAGVVQYGWVKISSNTSCKRYNERKLGPITEGMFCAAGHVDRRLSVDACQGDSGGPLECRKPDERQRVLLGITSFGYKCGLKLYPGIYTKVSKYVPWIRDIVTLGKTDDEDIGQPALISKHV